MLCRPIVPVALGVALACFSSFACAATCYVNFAATGTNNGASWANAYTDLQSALGNYPACLVIWVARGKYKPTATTDRTISFNVKPGVAIYGGFVGTELLIKNRILAGNPTILSGDIGIAGNNTDNSYHVVVMDGTTASGVISLGNVLDSLTISDGNADSSGPGGGGGLFCNGKGAGHQCSPELTKLIFENNRAEVGGAVFNDGSEGGLSSPYLHDVIVRGNEGRMQGGGIFNYGYSGGTSSPLIDGVTFTGNSAFVGGAIYNMGTSGNSSPIVRNSTFYANTASAGGAMVNNGQSGHAIPVLRYVTFYKNKADAAGGAIAALGDAAPNMSGVIFWADEAPVAPVEIYTDSLTPPSIEYSITPECPPAAVGCINADPLLGELQDNGGFAPTLRPEIGSPAIDNGNAGNCTSFDERGINRPQGAKCDIGAVELKPIERKICYVNGAAGATNNGLSWATAYVKLNNALADATCGEVWVAQGTYRPTTDSNRSASFVLQPGQAVYGGFAGNETILGQRDPASHVTILSGEIGNALNVEDNVYHVVLVDAAAAAVNVAGNTKLDGFTITGGYAEGTGTQRYGGGLLCNGQSPYSCKPTLSNLVFSTNHAMFGGGLANYGVGGVASPTVKNAVFTNNEASDQGGAVMNVGTTGVSSPVFSAIRFVGNFAAQEGGAMSSTTTDSFSDPQVSDSTFVSNIAVIGGAVATYGGKAHLSDVLFLRNGDPSSTLRGGAIATLGGGASVAVDRTAFVDNAAHNFGGAVWATVDTYDVLDGTNTSTQITNATFWGNQARFGSAVAAHSDSSAHANATLRSVTFAANTAALGYGTIYTDANSSGTGYTTLSNAILWGNSTSVEVSNDENSVTKIDHSLIEDGCSANSICTNVSAVDPLLGSLQYHGGDTPTLMPTASSPALNVGLNCPAVDQRGVARPQGAACDVGAVERRATEDYLFNNGFEF